jgi:hypothetical protein
MAVNLTVEDRGCGRIRRNLMTIIAHSDHPELRRIFAAQEAENAQGSPAETCVSTKTRPCPLRVKSAVLTVRNPVPVYPEERTSSDRPGRSGWCQKSA